MPYNTNAAYTANAGEYFGSTNAYPQPVNNSLWLGNNYSGGYSQMQQPPKPQQNPYMPAQTINNVISVMNAESAESFRAGPNSKVVMMNSSQPVFYLKCSDDSGFAQTRAFSYYEIPLHPESDEPVKTEHNESEPSLYLTKDEFNDFKKDMMDFKRMIEEMVTRNG